jgi:NADH-quinone oxidoreductase subunit G
LPEQKLSALSAAIEAGQVQVILSIGEDLIAAGLTAAQLAKVAVIYLGTHQNATSTVAQVVIPTLTVFEKAGTLVNQQFRLQKFVRAVPGVGGVSDDLVTLSHLLNALGGSTLGSTLGALWPVIAAEVKVLAHTTYDTLPSTGLLLDSATWAGLPFIEGETLHFKPVTAVGVKS